MLANFVTDDGADGESGTVVSVARALWRAELAGHDRGARKIRAKQWERRHASWRSEATKLESRGDRGEVGTRRGAWLESVIRDSARTRFAICNLRICKLGNSESYGEG